MTWLNQAIQEKHLTKSNTPIHDKKKKTIRKIGIKGNLLKLEQNVHKTPIVNIQLSGEELMFSP